MSLENAITTLNQIISDSGLLDELNEESKNKLLATVKVCSKTALLLLQQVFNKQYYPLMSGDMEAELMTMFIIYTVLNVVYPYTKDGPAIHKLINKYWEMIRDYCVENCLLYVIRDDTEVVIILKYLSETFYNIY